jgi:hypothetical protein
MTPDYKAQARELASVFECDHSAPGFSGNVRLIEDALLSADQSGAERMRAEAAKIAEGFYGSNGVVIAAAIRNIGAKDAKSAEKGCG